MYHERDHEKVKEELRQITGRDIECSTVKTPKGTLYVPLFFDWGKAGSADSLMGETEEEALGKLLTHLVNKNKEAGSDGDTKPDDGD